jgi:cytochrome oxidase Cu insertion factor (SCO1/SenC/PrrC family)
MRMRVPLLAIALAVILAGCGSGTSGGSPADGGTGASSDAAWRTTELVDVRNGASFTVDALAGQLVVIEPMAVWCTTCKIQQTEAAAALERLDDADIVYISAGVDPNERAEDLADYANDHGFAWRFVVAEPDFVRSLADEFGAQVLSPPSTPLIVVAQDGSVVHQSFGVHGAADLVELLTPHRS